MVPCSLVRLSNVILESAQEVVVGFANTVLSEHVVNLVAPVVNEIFVVVVAFCLVRDPDVYPYLTDRYKHGRYGEVA